MEADKDKQVVEPAKPVITLAVQYDTGTGSMDISCPEDPIMAGFLLRILDMRVGHVFHRCININEPKRGGILGRVPLIIKH